MNPKIRTILENHGISVELTEQIIKASDFGRRLSAPIRMESMPKSNDPAIIDISGDVVHYSIPRNELESILTDLGLRVDTVAAFIQACGFSAEESRNASTLDFNHRTLRELGILLVPLVSFGVLNGGSATSYFDAKKNQELSPALYGQFNGIIEEISKKYASLPKGMGPAFLQEETAHIQNYSFIELKLRAWLLLIRTYQKKKASLSFTLPWDGLEKEFPIFQMVSRATEKPLYQAFEEAKNSPLLKSLIEETKVNPCMPATGVQDLVAAFTVPDETGLRDIFLNAWGEKDRPLPLPGGHGQNFQVLAPIYRAMYKAGKRFAYVGNIDNLGFFPDSLGIALTALRNTEASFEFSFKTSLDRKGGVLVRSPEGRLSCGDIGPAVSAKAIQEAESQNQPILFNCATGLFKLKELCTKLDSIIDKLPIRFSNQDKDAGRYSQAEQVTWEVIGLLDNPLILGVSKQKRFLAAKFFLDCILTSGFGQKISAKTEQDRELLELGSSIHVGLRTLLSEGYGLMYEKGKWIPKP